MHSAKETAEGRLVRDPFQCLVSLGRRRDVRKGQRHARDHLHDEREHRCAAEDVPPAGVMRDEMFQARADQRRNPKPVIKPSPRADDYPFHSVVVIGMAMVLI
jgi:hypothetical protein